LTPFQGRPVELLRARRPVFESGSPARDRRFHQTRPQTHGSDETDAREKHADLLRPGKSVEVAAEAGGGPKSRAAEMGCDFDPQKDVRARVLAKLPELPGLSSVT